MKLEGCWEDRISNLQDHKTESVEEEISIKV